MPKVNLSGMTIEALMDLRKRVHESLLEHRTELQKQLERMDALVGGRRIVRGRASVLKGRKVPPKYRGPSGETWAGRGKNVGRSADLRYNAWSASTQYLSCLLSAGESVS